MAKKQIYPLLAILALLALSACGFHLRGVMPGVAGVKLFIDSASPFGDFERALIESANQAEIALVSAVDESQLVLRLQQPQVTRRVQTVDTAGRASDYELIMSIRYVLASPAELTDASERELDARREYSFDNEELLSKAEEEELLLQEMYRDLSSRLLRQISFQAAQQAVVDKQAN